MKNSDQGGGGCAPGFWAARWEQGLLGNLVIGGKLNSSKSWHWLMCALFSSHHMCCFSYYSQQLCEPGTHKDEEVRG